MPVDLSKYGGSYTDEKAPVGRFDFSKYGGFEDTSRGASPDRALNEQHPEIGVLERLKAKTLAVDAEDMAKHYAERGFETAVLDEANIALRRPGEPWRKLEPQGFLSGGIAEIGFDALDALKATPEIAGSVYGGIKGTAAGTAAGGPVGGIALGLAGAATGSGAGEAIKRGLAEMAGWDIPAEKAARSIGREAAYGAAGEGAGRLIGAGARAGKGALSKIARRSGERAPAVTVKRAAREAAEGVPASAEVPLERAHPATRSVFEAGHDPLQSKGVRESLSADDLMAGRRDLPKPPAGQDFRGEERIATARKFDEIIASMQPDDVARTSFTKRTDGKLRQMAFKTSPRYVTRSQLERAIASGEAGRLTGDQLVELGLDWGLKKSQLKNLGPRELMEKIRVLGEAPENALRAAIGDDVRDQFARIVGRDPGGIPGDELLDFLNQTFGRSPITGGGRAYDPTDAGLRWVWEVGRKRGWKSIDPNRVLEKRLPKGVSAGVGQTAEEAVKEAINLGGGQGALRSLAQMRESRRLTPGGLRGLAGKGLYHTGRAMQVPGNFLARTFGIHPDIVRRAARRGLLYGPASMLTPAAPIGQHVMLASATHAGGRGLEWLGRRILRDPSAVLPQLPKWVQKMLAPIRLLKTESARRGLLQTLMQDERFRSWAEGPGAALLAEASSD